jgi:hypothetical protein
VDSFTFHSPLFSGDSNFANRQMINKMFTADRHSTTTKDRTAGANNTLPSCGFQCNLKVCASNYLCIGLTVLCSEIPHERQAANRYRKPYWRPCNFQLTDF